MGAANRPSIWLILSLALNLFVIGILAGAGVMVWRAGESRRDAQGATVQATRLDTLWALSLRLSPPHRDALQALLREESDALAEPIHKVRTARRHAVDALGADQLDAALVRQSLTESRKGEAEVRDALQDRVVAFMTTLSPEERKLLADAVVRAHPGRPADAGR